VNKERRLGRGLEALLGRPAGAEGEPLTVPINTAVAMASHQGPSSTVAEPTGAALQISLHAIDRNPFQPRQEFDESSLAELAASIQNHGIIQPLVVRRKGDRFELISGERRLRAATHAGWSEVPVFVRDADDRQVAEIAIVENLQRKDLNPLEKAASFEQYLARYQCTQEELAGRLSIDRSTIANLIRLLELPPGVQEALRAGRITQGHARALLPLGDEREQLTFCQRICDEGLSVRRTEELVSEAINSEDQVAPGPIGVVATSGKKAKPKRTRSAQIASLEQELRSALGVKAEIKQAAAGRGKIVIHFNNHDEFERLMDHIAGEPVPPRAAM